MYRNVLGFYSDGFFISTQKLQPTTVKLN